MSDYKYWSEMTEEERAPILMAHRMGMTIQWLSVGRKTSWRDDLKDDGTTSSFLPNVYDLAYRIKPHESLE